MENANSVRPPPARYTTLELAGGEEGIRTLDTALDRITV
jgi:hypothetical protein